MLCRTRSIHECLSSCASWPERFPPEQWAIYKRVIAEARGRGLPFAVGGGLAAMTYAGQWRNTKDIDLYVVKSNCEDMIHILTALGLKDYYEKEPYDRKWIYRSYNNDTIVDVMWAMANQRAAVDESWLEGPEVEAGGERFRLLRPEEALWSKLYVLQRDRTDWPDGLNLLYGVGPHIDWRRLLQRLADDTALLAGLLITFRWLCPPRARELPSWLWTELGLELPNGTEDPGSVGDRASLLDSRPWFTPTLDKSQTDASNS